MLLEETGALESHDEQDLEKKTVSHTQTLVTRYDIAARLNKPKEMLLDVLFSIKERLDSFCLSQQGFGGVGRLMSAVLLTYGKV